MRFPTPIRWFATASPRHLFLLPRETPPAERSDRCHSGTVLDSLRNRDAAHRTTRGAPWVDGPLARGCTRATAITVKILGLNGIARDCRAQGRGRWCCELAAVGIRLATHIARPSPGGSGRPTPRAPGAPSTTLSASPSQPRRHYFLWCRRRTSVRPRACRPPLAL